MIKIGTIAELRSERHRLNNKREMLAEEIKMDFEDLKESLKPLNMIKDFFSSDKHEQNGQEVPPVMLGLGSTALDLIVSKLLFNKSSYIKKLVSSYLIRAAGPTVLQKYGPSVVGMVKSVVGYFKKKSENHQLHERSTAANWYED